MRMSVNAYLAARSDSTHIQVGLAYQVQHAEEVLSLLAHLSLVSEIRSTLH